uniref:Serine/threonine-protein kinase BSK1-like TPR repeats domain-containing protein n=1 Tax=Triticum urartu TaxID=4572 RepID=A0A8R7U4U8_TRIUA
TRDLNRRHSSSLLRRPPFPSSPSHPASERKIAAPAPPSPTLDPTTLGRFRPKTQKPSSSVRRSEAGRRRRSTAGSIGGKARMGEQDDKNTKAELKLCGDVAVKRKNYRGASAFYSEAIELDPSDATLYANRSLCYLQMTEAGKALRDANTCIKLRPEWLKGYYRKGAALMSFKV